MHKRPFKITMIMLFLLTFISQAMASSLMSYKMSAMDNSFEKQQLANTNTLDSHHDEASDSVLAHNDLVPHNETGNEDGKECCSKNSKCLILGCVVTTLTSSLHIQQVVASPAVKYTPLTVLAFSQQSKSLYRPPING